MPKVIQGAHIQIGGRQKNKCIKKKRMSVHSSSLYFSFELSLLMKSLKLETLLSENLNIYKKGATVCRHSVLFNTHLLQCLLLKRVKLES